jgi:hypothetical protein
VQVPDALNISNLSHFFDRDSSTTGQEGINPEQTFLLAFLILFSPSSVIDPNNPVLVLTGRLNPNPCSYSHVLSSDKVLWSAGQLRDRVEMGRLPVLYHTKEVQSAAADDTERHLDSIHSHFSNCI